MKIELIIDANCISVNTYMDTANRLTHEFPDIEITVISFDDDRQRLKNLGINVLPAWIINDNVIRIRADDYQALKENIIGRL